MRILHVPNKIGYGTMQLKVSGMIPMYLYTPLLATEYHYLGFFMITTPFGNLIFSVCFFLLINYEFRFHIF